MNASITFSVMKGFFAAKDTKNTLSAVYLYIRVKFWKELPEPQISQITQIKKRNNNVDKGGKYGHNLYRWQG